MCSSRGSHRARSSSGSAAIKRLCRGSRSAPRGLGSGCTKAVPSEVKADIGTSGRVAYVRYRTYTPAVGHAKCPHYVRRQTVRPSDGIKTARMKTRSPPQQPAAQNQLIARLWTAERSRLLARCEMVQLRPADVLSEPGAPIHHVYFPVQGFISMVAL